MGAHLSPAAAAGPAPLRAPTAAGTAAGGAAVTGATAVPD